MTWQWVATGASARGAAHIRAGKPNQDCAGWIGPKFAEAVITAVVSDGHGGADHDQSHIGSALAVSIGIDEAQRLSATHDGRPPTALPEVDGLIGRIHGRWAAAIAGSETAGLEAAMRRHGATLVGAHLSGRNLCLFQIGDGDILLVHRSGRVERPLPRDPDLVGEETHSLCEIDAPDYGHCAVITVDHDDPVVLIMLSTDGVGKSFADDHALEKVALGFAKAAARGEFAEIAGRLGQWASDLSARGSSDDASLVLIAQIPETVAEAVAPARDVRQPMPVRRVPWGMVAASALVGALVGVGSVLVTPKIADLFAPHAEPVPEQAADPAAPATALPTAAPVTPATAPSNDGKATESPENPVPEKTEIVP